MNRKVAFISEHASPLAVLGGTDSGGQNVYVTELARQLAKQGYEVDIFTRRDHMKLHRVVTIFPGVRVIHIVAGPARVIPKEELLMYMDDFRRDMMDFIAQENIAYQLIHANFWMSAMVGLALKVRYKIPLVVTFHALGKVRRYHLQQKDNFPDERLIIEEEIAHKADCIVAECPQDERDLITLYGADSRNIVVVPCGFSPIEFYPIEKYAARRRLGLPANEKIVLQLGRIVQRKGIDNVINALKYVKRNLKIRLLVVGGDGENEQYLKSPELIRLKRLALQVGKGVAIDFVGPKKREELKFYYNAADVFVSTPWYEPFGITPLEAMACGTPVIGSNVGGIKYSVVDGVTGCLVEPRRPKELAEKLNQVLTIDKLEMGKKGIERVNNLFTWEKVSRAIEGIYDALIEVNEVLLEGDNAIEKIKNRYREKKVLDFSRSDNKLGYTVLGTHHLTKQHHAS